MTRLDPEYDRNVFINCPFDPEYTPVFEAIVFAIHGAGFVPRSARERLDSSEIRLQKIIRLIRISRCSIHDLSRTELDVATLLPRFNMPLELGLDLGCKAFSSAHKGKSFLIFDVEEYRFHKYLSDIGGQDVHRHGNDPQRAVFRVRDWLRAESGVSDIPGGATIYRRYLLFRSELPSISEKLGLDAHDLAFADFSFMIADWLKRHP